MLPLQIIFYVFSATAIISGLMVVAAKNPVHGALFLVVTFFATAGIWMLLHSEFLALILVLVYVGAVMTLFLFVVMMLQVKLVSLREGFVRYLPFAVLLVLLITGLAMMAVGSKQFDTNFSPVPQESANFSNTANLGDVLYTEYAYPFEIAAVLLLTAIVAAISLTHRKPSNNKTQDSSKQISVRRDQRIRLVSMPSNPLERKLK